MSMSESNKWQLGHDGKLYWARLSGGSGVVFGDTEQLVMSRARFSKFAHTQKVGSNNNTWRGSKDYDLDAD